MKKIFLTLIILLTSNLCAFAEESVSPMTLNGSIQYTVESAKKLAFSGLALKLDRKLIEPYWQDEKNKENREALKLGKMLPDRALMEFSSKFVKGYAVTFNDKPNYSYYYVTRGILAAVDYNSNPENEVYPFKIGKYDAFGNLRSVALYISGEEQYSYSKSGKLLAHWVGDIGYNENGKVFAHRRLIED